MSFGVTEAVEVASDVCGMVSGVVLLYSTHRITAARALLHQQLKTLLARAGTTNVDDLKTELTEAAKAIAEYDPRDSVLLHAGVWALAASFALKLVYHWMTKLP